MTLDTSYHSQIREDLGRDPEFASEYQRTLAAIRQVDEIVRELDGRRRELRLSKADLARMIGKNPAQIRRLFTAGGNPEMQTISALTIALGGRLKPAFGQSKRKPVPTG